MIAFWLSPAAEAAEFFDGLIKELAERYNAPRFEPHVTLAGGDISDDRALEILQNLSIRQPIELSVTGIEHSDKYTKTLFVQFESTPQIEALSAELQKAIGGNYELNPHLSLLYKEMPEASKAEAAEAISLPFSTVQFESVKAIVTPMPITRSEDITAWRTLLTRRLDFAAQ